MLQIRIICFRENNVKDHFYSSAWVVFASEVQDRLPWFFLNRTIEVTWVLRYNSLQFFIMSKLNGIDCLLMNLHHKWSIAYLIKHWILVIDSWPLHCLVVFLISNFTFNRWVPSISDFRILSVFHKGSRLISMLLRRINYIWRKRVTYTY